MTLTIVAIITAFLLGVLFWQQYGWWIHKNESPDDDTLDAFIQNLNTDTLFRVSIGAQDELSRRKKDS